MKYFLAVVTILYGLSFGVGERVLSARELIKKACKEYAVDYDLALRIAYVESRFDQKAFRRNKNDTIDVGMFQVNSIHHMRLCRGLDVYSLEGNTYCAIKILSGLKRRYKLVDNHWYGRYHSRTIVKKLAYVEKLRKVKL